MKKTGLLFVFSAVLLSSFVLITLTEWNIKDNYAVRFSGSGAAGTFEGLKGKVAFDPNDLSTAVMDVSVDVKTIDTGNSTKDKHAVGKDWFDAEKYPQIRFRSQKFEKTRGGYAVTGELTMHGITREETIPFVFNRSSGGGEFKGTFKINRKEYGIKGPIASVFVGSEFEVELRVPVER